MVGALLFSSSNNNVIITTATTNNDNDDNNSIIVCIVIVVAVVIIITPSRGHRGRRGPRPAGRGGSKCRGSREHGGARQRQKSTLTRCDVHTRTPAQKSPANFMLYPFVI